jgi:nucleoid-associated protein YgaU
MRIPPQPIVLAGLTPLLALALALVVAACIPASLARPGATGPGPAESPDLALASTIPTGTGPSAPPSFVRPTATPQPTFFAYVVKRGDTLTSIARAHRTTARSIAFWNRAQHPSLDPDSSSYAPNRIEVGWILLLVPDLELDPEELEPEPTPAPSPTPYSPYGG